MRGFSCCGGSSFFLTTLAQRQSIIFQKTRNLSTTVRTSYVTDFLTKLVDGLTDLELYLLIVQLTKSPD